jgi:hypothetical protein
VETQQISKHSVTFIRQQEKEHRRRQQSQHEALIDCDNDSRDNNNKGNINTGVNNNNINNSQQQPPQKRQHPQHDANAGTSARFCCCQVEKDALVGIIKNGEPETSCNEVMIARTKTPDKFLKYSICFKSLTSTAVTAEKNVNEKE